MLPHVFSLMMRLCPRCAPKNMQVLVSAPPKYKWVPDKTGVHHLFFYNIIMPPFIRKFPPGVGCHFIMGRSAEYFIRRASPQLHHAAPIHLDVMSSRRQRNAIAAEDQMPSSMQCKWSVIIWRRRYSASVQPGWHPRPKLNPTEIHRGGTNSQSLNEGLGDGSQFVCNVCLFSHSWILRHLERHDIGKFSCRKDNRLFSFKVPINTIFGIWKTASFSYQNATQPPLLVPDDSLETHLPLYFHAKIFNCFGITPFRDGCPE